MTTDSAYRGPGRKKAVKDSPDKPPVPPVHADRLPPSLTAQDVWLCWRWWHRPGQGWTKPPLSARTLKKCDVTDPAALGPFAAALARLSAGEVDGVGVTLAAVGLLGIDLDDCRDPATGDIAPWAAEIVAALDGYAEVSPSGTGVKVLVAAVKPGPRCRTGDIELYDRGRYFTVTGDVLPDSRPEPPARQDAVDALYARLFPPTDTAGPGHPPGAPPPAAGTTVGSDPGDDELLAVAFRAKGGDRLRRLWDGDTTGYGSASEADLALCSRLGFYFPDPARLNAVFRRSALYRSKWDRADYRERTLAKALDGRTEFYTPRGRRADARTGSGIGNTKGAGDRPVIVIGCDQGRVNDEAAAALPRAGDVYHRGGVLVQVVEQSSDSPDDADIRRQAGAVLVRELPVPLVQDRLSRVADWVRVVRRKDGDEEQPAAPPGWAVAAVSARGQWRGLPRLAGVVSYPVFLPDGDILCTAGYHRPTGLLVRPAPGLDLSVPDRPDRTDVMAAVETLLDVVCDFPFESPAHRAAWLAGLLTLPAWPAFAGPAPMFLIDGNVRGVGKGLLADLIALIVLGGRFPVMSFTNDAEELRKRITTLAAEGERAVLLDNLSGPVGNGVLDAALTSDRWKDRLLGSNRTYDGPLSVCWYATGNNCELRADTGRRTCHVRLETPDERPELKSGFRHPKLRQHVRRHRARLLSAVLKILRGWHMAGRPTVGLPPWGSFEEWSDLVRECLVWAGLPDPGDTRQELLSRADRDADAMGELLRELIRIDPHREGRTAGEIVEAGRTDSAVRAAVEDVAGHLDAKKLGYRLRTFARRVFDGLFLDHVGEGGRGKRWGVYQKNEFLVRRSASPSSPPSPRPGAHDGGDDGHEAGPDGD